MVTSNEDSFQHFFPWREENNRSVRSTSLRLIIIGFVIESVGESAR